MSRTFGHDRKLPRYNKETKAVRRMLNRSHRFVCKNEIRLSEEPPKWSRSNGWITW